MGRKRTIHIEVFKQESKKYNQLIENQYRNFAPLKTSIEVVYDQFDTQTSNLEVQSYAYLFSYDVRNIIRSKGMNLIANVAHDGGLIDRDSYVNKIIQEQRGLYTWEVRKVTQEIFNSNHEIFEKHKGEYLYLCDLTIRDKKGVPWHTHHIIEPIAYDQDMLLVIYCARVYFINKGTNVHPNYLSIHAGGILISEEPINNFTALQLMPKGFPITHFDMYGAEALQFHKFDILSQRGLGHIRDAVKLVQQNQSKSIDIHDIPRIIEDPKVKEKLKTGHAIGCFYIESPAMRGLLTKLKCDNYTHLVAASSIIRPGVAKSGMMKAYIERSHDPSKISYLHPIFGETLAETYGIMVYQEDVMKIVHHFAGLDLAESDILRRIMTGKKKNSQIFESLKKKFFDNCKKRQYPDELSHEVWRQIASFSGYSFCKAHSASFAVESFQSLYLKTYFPLEFMVAVINNFGGFYPTELYVHEARMLGGQVEAPCVNRSIKLTQLYGQVIYLGFIHVASFEANNIENILLERQANGAFRSLGDFVRRVSISREQLSILMRIGAFRFTGMSKYELMWEKIAVHNPEIQTLATAEIFPAVQESSYQLPKMKESKHEQAFDEIELLGFPLCSPFDLLVDERKGKIKAQEMPSHIGKITSIVGYFVIKKHVTTVRNRHMNFASWVDVDGEFFDTIHFPPSLEKFPFQGKACYHLYGKIVEDFGFPSMEVYSMEKMAIVRDEIREAV